MNLLASLLAVSLFTGAIPAPAVRPSEAASLEQQSEALKNAKALFFDRQYVAARDEWARIAAAEKGELGESATYWVARCSEALGESERSFREYGAYLDLKPRDARLAEEAEIARLGIAARLSRAGRPGFAATLLQALRDERETVRHFGALQVASSAGADARKAVPVLKEIVSRGEDPDIVERAKLQLLRLEPEALAPAPAPRPSPSPRRLAGSSTPAPRPTPRVSTRDREDDPQGTARLLRIRITEGGRQKLAVTIPFSLAEFVFNALPSGPKRELERNGYDAEAFWKRLRRMNIREILSITGEDGELIEIWIE